MIPSTGTTPTLLLPHPGGGDLFSVGTTLTAGQPTRIDPVGVQPRLYGFGLEASILSGEFNMLILCNFLWPWFQSLFLTSIGSGFILPFE